MRQTVPYLCVFVSSPSDVKDERKIALDVIDRLQYRPAFRDKVAFRVIAWDKPGAGTAMRASLTPQEAINAKLPKPSECDIVIVIFWSRIGTKFEMGGKQFESGTHWELLDALDSNHPFTYIYKRTEDIAISMSDSKRAEKQDQFERLSAFLKGDLFYDSDGTIKRGINFYNNPDEFRQHLELHLEECLVEILEEMATTPPPSSDPTPADSPNITTFEPKVWTGSPFPGLRAFTEADAPIFFGRGRETDALVHKVENGRFIAVVGASGSGKSSLVAAGLIPRLTGQDAPSRDWFYVRFTPSTDPFNSLTEALLNTVDSVHQFDIDITVEVLRQNPNYFGTLIEILLKDTDPWVEILFFVDQFEEVFTLSQEPDQKPFIELLLQSSQRKRIVVTMRADFYHRAVPLLEDPLRTGTFTLDKPSIESLLDMIQRPAERAGLQFEDKLPDKIIYDTGDEPGALALMAYALDELYQVVTTDNRDILTFADYRAIGGVKGAIGKRAETAFERIPGTQAEKIDYLSSIFKNLISVDDRGVATRRRIIYNTNDVSPSISRAIDILVDARLLTRDAIEYVNGSTSSQNLVTLEVAHEALFNSWERLYNWIGTVVDDYRFIYRLRQAANEWNRNRRDVAFLWPSELLRKVDGVFERLDLNPATYLTAIEVEFLNNDLDQQREIRRQEQEQRMARLQESARQWEENNYSAELLWTDDEIEAVVNTIEELNLFDSLNETQMRFLGFKRELMDDELPHAWRQRLANEMSILKIMPGVNLNQNGLPDIAWQYVSSEDGQDLVVDIVGKRHRLSPFYISRFPITRVQYIAMKITGDMPLIEFPNHPMTNISFHEAEAYCHWLTMQMGFHVRLPTEAEWVAAAQGRHPDDSFPWGSEWNSLYANTEDAGIAGTMPVGVYPFACSKFGVEDMIGNVWEWCADEFSRINTNKVLHGGSFLSTYWQARPLYRHQMNPSLSDSDIGFRICATNVPVEFLRQTGVTNRY